MTKSMRLRDSREWLLLVADDDPFRSSKAHVTLKTQLTTENIDELIGFYDSGRDDEVIAAQRILLDLCMSQSELLRADQKRLLEGIAAAKTRRRYSQGSLDVKSFYLWRCLERERANAFVLREVDWSRLDVDSAKTVVTWLRAIKSAEALARLQEIASDQGSVAQEARRALEAAGIVPREKLLQTLANFRRQRDATTLRDVYEYCIAHLPENTPLAELVETLGEPTDSYRNSVWYRAGGLSLYLESDDSGNLTVHKLT